MSNPKIPEVSFFLMFRSCRVIETKSLLKKFRKRAKSSEWKRNAKLEASPDQQINQALMKFLSRNAWSRSPQRSPPYKKIKLQQIQPKKEEEPEM